MRSRIRAIIVLSMCLAVVATAWPASAAPGQQTRADRRLARSIHRLVRLPGGPPGAIAVVQRGARLRTFKAGFSDIDLRRRMRPWMHMRIASTSKAYSGAIALSLVDRGFLSLDDTVGDFLPWTNPDWHRVTLAQALHHTSGIPDFSASKKFIDALLASLDVAPAPRTLLNYVRNKDLLFEPDTEYRYSNSDNIVVALMVKAARQRKYTSLLAKRVTIPLGLGGTSLSRGLQLFAPYMHGYNLNGSSWEDQTFLIASGWAWASGGMVSTPLDQNRFVRGYVGRALFGADVQQEQFDWVEGHSDPPGPGRNSAGLAIFRYRTKCGTVFGHTGSIFGFTQFFAASRDGKRSAVVSVNQQITPELLPDLFPHLRRVFERATCSALA